MEWNSQRITELTWKYIKEELSASEREELDAWLSDPYNLARFEERVKAENILEDLMLWNLANDEAGKKEWSFGQEAGGAKILPMGEFSQRNVHRGRWIAAAAAVVVLAGTATLWKRFQKNDTRQVKVAAAPTILPPGRNKAVLILADGKTVDLDDASKGTVARQGGAEAVKEESGQLVYHNKGSAVAVENTIATPRGGQYRVVLPDGSRVWLNADSKIRFPTAFTGPNREITVEGEAYLEVSPDAVHPFIVKAGSMNVRVLGTAFDIIAYQDEKAVRTALVTGAVEVSSGGEKVKLRPRQEARLGDGGTLSVGACDVDQVVAWKNGFLDFRGADIGTVMRSVMRWWNVDVLFSGVISPELFTGQLNESLTGQEALQILTASGYHFNINGKTIIVLP